jgi:O-methyltransferase
MDYVKAMVFKLWTRRLIRPFVRSTEEAIVFPWAAKRGWRPSSLRSIRPEDLKWDFGFQDEDQIKAALSIVAPYTVVSMDRLASLWWQLRYLDTRNLQGALVECGVRFGGSAAMMALAHMANVNPPQRRIHLFDSFEPMPEPKEIDGAWAAEQSKLWKIDAKKLSPDTSRKLLIDTIGYPDGMVTQHVGWFHNTVPQAAEAIGSIAMLRLDADLYESTKICLESLYSWIVPGGIVVIDDYNYFEGCKAAVDEFNRSLPQRLLHRIDATGVYWIK